MNIKQTILSIIFVAASSCATRPILPATPETYEVANECLKNWCGDDCRIIRCHKEACEYGYPTTSRTARLHAAQLMMECKMDNGDLLVLRGNNLDDTLQGLSALGAFF